MKNLSLILCLFAGYFSQAQSTITQANMPSINDTIRYSVSNSNTLNFIQTGANYTWDYSTLNRTSQDIYRFQALLSTPYASLAFTGMPAGAIGYKIADSIGAGQAAFKNLYNFYEKKSTGWSAVGTGFTLSALPFPAGGVYKDKDEIYTFPLNYNDQDSTTFEVSTPLGNALFKLGTFKQKGYRINTVEGWGIIKTPYGNNISCLKIKSRIVESDSLKITTPATNLGFQANRVEYRWLSTAEKIPVLEVTGTVNNGTFTPNTIRYRDTYKAVSGSPLLPKVKFTANAYTGKTVKDTFTLNNLSSPNFGLTYQWTITPSLGVRFINGTNAASKTPKLLFDSAGRYTVKLQATNLIGSKDSTATNMITISKDNVKSVYASIRSNLNVYPIPSQGILYFNQEEFINLECRIFDLNGKLIQSSIIDNNLSINIKNLAAGNYTVVVNYLNQAFYTQISKS
jgi:hypothetical protein